MNKLEFLEKTEEVRDLIAEGKYDLAVEICDTLNLNGVKDTRELQNIAKAYERCRRYDEAERLLQRVRKAAPRSRSVLFRLCVVSARAGHIEDAKDYLSDFMELAPTDPERYILEYRIAEAEGGSDDEKIQILEKYLSEETDDRWMYTLAELYVKNGREEEGAGVLNAIILWFDSGKYVAKAHAMLVKLGYEERPEDPMGDIPVASEMKAEFPDVEFAEPEEIQPDPEEEEEAETEAAEGEEAEEEAEAGEAEAEEEAEEAAEAAETEAETEEALEEAEPEELSEADALAEAAELTEESVEALAEKEDEHVVMNITSGRGSDFIRPRVDEEDKADEEIWKRVFDEADGKGTQEASEAAEALLEEAEEAAEEAEAEAEEFSEAALPEEALLEEAEISETEEFEAAEEFEEAEAFEEAEEAVEAEEAEEAPAAIPEEEPEAAEAAPAAQKEAAENVPEASDAPIVNFKNEEYGEVIAAEIRRRKEARIMFGNIPLEPEMSNEIWHFIAYGETDELALECAREHVKEIAGTNPNCPKKLLKISAEKIGRASIVSSMDRFLGNVVIVEHVALLSDDQLREFAKMLDKDDMSLLTVFTDTKENVVGVLKRVPELAEIFSAVYEGKKYTSEELVHAAEYYLKTEEARLTPAAEQIVRDYAESLLEEKAGFYRNRVIAFTSKALEAADRGGFLGFGAGKIDKNGILVIDTKHFKNL